MSNYVDVTITLTADEYRAIASQLDAVGWNLTLREYLEQCARDAASDAASGS